MVVWWYDFLEHKIYTLFAVRTASFYVYAIERWLKPRVLCNTYTIHPKEKTMPPYHHTTIPEGFSSPVQYSTAGFPSSLPLWCIGSSAGEPRYSALAFAPQSLNVYAIERWLKPRVLCNLYTIYPKEKIIPPYHHTCTRRIFISSTTSAADF